jgi:O-antigen ligase
MIALIIAPAFSFYFDTIPKLVVLLIGTALLLPLACSVTFRTRERKLASVWTLLLVLTLLSLAVSTVLSANRGLSLFGTNWRRFGAITQATVLLFAWLVTLTCAGIPERVRLILRAISICGAITAIYGIAQYFGWDPFLPKAAYHVGEGATTIVRPPGTLGYASYFATWLLMAIFLCAAQARMESSPRWRGFAFTVIPFAAFAMFLTGTRAAIVGLGIGILVWLWMQKPKLGARAMLVATLALGGIAAFYYSPAGLQMRSRARWFAEDPWGGARGKLWRDSMRMALDRPAVGYGPEVFTAEFPLYESVALAEAYPDFSHESPHNIFLDSFVAQGVPGLLLMVCLCAIPFTSRRHVELSSAAAAGIASQQFTAFTLPTALLFFVTLGLFVALETPPFTERRRMPVTLLAAAVSIALIIVAVRFGLADHALQKAKGFLERSDLEAAESSYQQYERMRLPGGAADLWYSRALLDLAARSPNPKTRGEASLRSLAVAEKATQTSEDPFNAWYNAAVVFGLRNDGPHAAQCLRLAVAAHPKWFKPHWVLAQMLRLEGRLQSAEKEATLAVELDGRKHPEVAQTLREIQEQSAATSQHLHR